MSQASSSEGSGYFRAILSDLPAAVLVTDCELGGVFANAAWESLCGLPAEEALGQGWLATVHADDRARLLELWRASARDGRRFCHDFRLVTRSAELAAHIAANPVVIAGGGLCGYTAVFRETPGARGEAEPPLSVSDLPIAALEWDSELRLRGWSEGAERMFGWRAGEVLGRRLDEFRFIHESDWDQVCKLTSDMLGGRRPRSEHFNRNYRKNGAVIYCEWHNSVRSGRAGNLVLSLALDETLRHRAQEAARRADDRLRAALDASGTGTYHWDIATSCLECDENLLRLLGVPANGGPSELAEFLGVVDPEDRASVIRGFERSAFEGTGFNEDFRVVWPDGSVHWLTGRGKVHLDATGRPGYMTGACVEITERRLAARKLHRAYSEIYRILESITDGFYSLDREWRYTYINETARARIGRAREEIVGRSVWEVIPAIAGSGFEAECRRAMETQTPRTVEHCIPGEDRWYESRLYPLETGLSVYERDVTDHKRLEEERRRSQERFRLLAEAIPHIVWTAGPSGAIDYSNARWFEFTGLSEEETYADQGWTAAYHSGDAQRLVETWERCVRSGDVFELEARLRRASDGAYRWQLVRAAPVRDEEGAVVKWFGTCTDTQDQKTAEEAIRQTQKLESLGLLAGGVAHDFNNLLTGILGNASLALELLPPSSQLTGILEDVIAASERAAHLTRQMLAYSGKGRFVIEAVNLSAVVEEMARLLESSVSKKVRLQLSLAAGLPAVEADAAQMSQLVMNLVTNAAEAIGDERGTVSVSTAVREIAAGEPPPVLVGNPQLAPGPYVALEVTDTGCGMDDATLAQVWDPFFSTKFTGRGLGLSAVMGIVRGHGGGIHVESRVGQGSRFLVLLPAKAGPRTKPGPVLAAPAETRAQAGTTVLVVDDEDLVRKTVQIGLERWGYTVLAAASGEEAIEVLAREAGRVSVVLLDLSMPGMSGREALPELRRVKPDFDVVVSSGYTEAATLDMFRGQQVSGFIQKPYTIAKLVEKLRAVSGKR